MRVPTLLFIMLLSCAALSAEVYRSVDSEGNFVYTDRPSTGDEEPVSITFDGVTAQRATQSGSLQAGASESSETPGSDDPNAGLAADASAEQRQEERAQNCVIARERNATYEVAHRLYREQPDGERVYLEDSEIDEARLRALADIETWCD